MGQIYNVAKALNSASGRLFSSRLSQTLSQETRTRITNAIDNMGKYPSIFEDLEKVASKPNAQKPEWRAQVDAILYTPMDDNAAQRLIALIETVDADGK